MRRIMIIGAGNPGGQADFIVAVGDAAIRERVQRALRGSGAHVPVLVHSSASIGRGAWVGAGATVSNNVSICEGCVVGAGAVVVRDIVQPGTYVGVPARLIKGSEALTLP